MSGDPTPYLDLIASEHAGKARFRATVSLSVQPYVDQNAVLKLLPLDFDLDVAIGAQLDAVGLWVGRTRFLTVPLNVYFSFDIDGLGFDQGVWKGPFDPTTGITRLADPAYRTLLRATIVSNQWDGSIPVAYRAWDLLFAGTGYSIFLQDYGDMSMAMALVGQPPDAVTLALFTTGELDLKPAGVRFFHVLPTDYTVPFFGLDSETGAVSGLDVGAWANFISSE